MKLIYIQTILLYLMQRNWNGASEFWNISSELEL
jgi:hypothetical protein